MTAGITGAGFGKLCIIVSMATFVMVGCDGTDAPVLALPQVGCQDVGADVELVLLDNFPVWQTQIAVQRRDSRSPATKLESSGGLSLESAAAYAATGVDYLAVGALTHSVRVLDIGLDS